MKIQTNAEENHLLEMLQEISKYISAAKKIKPRFYTFKGRHSP